jgi:hypothetical protein
LVAFTNGGEQLQTGDKAMSKRELARYVITRLAEKELEFKEIPDYEYYFEFYRTCARIAGNRKIREAIDIFWGVQAEQFHPRLAAD